MRRVGRTYWPWRDHNIGMSDQPDPTTAMDDSPPPATFLFVGRSNTDAAVSKLKAYGIRYEHKLLESSPANWSKICRMLRNPELDSVIAKFSLPNLNRMVDPSYQEVAKEMVRELGTRRHLVLIYEGILLSEPSNYHHLMTPNFRTYGGSGIEIAGYSPDEEIPDYEHFQASPMLGSEYLSDLSPDNLKSILATFENAGVKVLPYRTNAELSLLTAEFVEDVEHDLLFRVYIPHGRLYAAEAAKVLDLFRDWFNRAGHGQVRQSGYDTSAGSVFELFGDGEIGATDLRGSFGNFEQFLSDCIEFPMRAVESLASHGLSTVEAGAVVNRHAREARRLRRDLDQERERRVMELRHRFELELDDLVESRPNTKSEIAKIVDANVPTTAGLLETALTMGRESPGPVTITIDQRTVNAINSTVVQNVTGSINLSPEAAGILELIAKFAGQEQSSLESAVYELEDVGLKLERRLSARQQIKAFLLRAAPGIGRTTLEVAQKYVESKLGLST